MIVCAERTDYQTDDECIAYPCGFRKFADFEAGIKALHFHHNMFADYSAKQR